MTTIRRSEILISTIPATPGDGYCPDTCFCLDLKEGSCRKLGQDLLWSDGFRAECDQHRAVYVAAPPQG